MNLYMTLGTADFMEKLVVKYKNEEMILLHGQGSAVVLHETDKKSVFVSPRSYEIVDGSGQLQQRGYFVMHHLPLDGESREVYIQHFKDVSAALKSEDLLLAFRLLAPRKKSDPLVFLTQWVGPSLYEAWLQTKSYKNSFAQLLSLKASSVQKIFDGDGYISTYTAPIPE